MKLQLAILAQGTSTDRFSNRLSIFNLIERIEASTFPFLIPEAAFVIVLRRESNEPSQFDTEILVRLGDVVVAKANTHIDFEDKFGARHIVNFQGFPVFNPGELTFQFGLPGGEVIQASVPVVQQETTPPNVQAAH